MRFLIHSNGPTVPSGYGVQTALLALRLKAEGHEVAISAYVGLLLSWYYDLAAGAMIVLVAITIFFAVLVVQSMLPARRPHPEHA